MNPLQSESNIVFLPELRKRRFVFRDRYHAGEILADMLKQEKFNSAFVLGIPAGGVPVGVVIADRLHLPFDVSIVSKITLPWNSEAGYGAVAFDGTVKLNRNLLSRVGLNDKQVQDGISKTKEKIKHRLTMLRGDRPLPKLSGMTTILVDDGLASGFTMMTAIEALRNADADRIIVAVPTGHDHSVDTVVELADRVLCANIRSGLSFAVADAYENWYDVSDRELMSLLSNLT
jgi:putative phosphoribosyl transferase